jgi:hypothetical protein
MKTRSLVLVVAGIASLSIGCKGSPAAPFNTLQDSQITAFRLQNYEAPGATATTPTTTPTATSPIPGLPGLPIPAEFQPQVQQAQTMICSFLPPGSPGCGAAAGATATPVATAVPNAPMFEGFRIIGQAQVMDPDLREQIIDIFGYEKSFDSKKSPCMFPELGLSFGGGAQQGANVLVSFSCNQVQARNFNWPHADTGLTQKTVQNLSQIIQKLFGGG